MDLSYLLLSNPANLYHVYMTDEGIGRVSEEKWADHLHFLSAFCVPGTSMCSMSPHINDVYLIYY